MLTKCFLFHHLALWCWLSYLLAEHESPWERVSGLGAAWPGLVARHYYHSCQVPARLCTSHSQDSYRHCQVFSRKWIVSIDRIVAVIEHCILKEEWEVVKQALVHTPVTEPPKLCHINCSLISSQDVHKEEHIFPYNCDRKEEFIRKGQGKYNFRFLK